MDVMNSTLWGSPGTRITSTESISVSPLGNMGPMAMTTSVSTRMPAVSVTDAFPPEVYAMVDESIPSPLNENRIGVPSDTGVNSPPVVSRSIAVISDVDTPSAVRRFGTATTSIQLPSTALKFIEATAVAESAVAVIRPGPALWLEMWVITSPSELDT